MPGSSLFYFHLSLPLVVWKGYLALRESLLIGLGSYLGYADASMSALDINYMYSGW